MRASWRRWQWGKLIKVKSRVQTATNGELHEGEPIFHLYQRPRILFLATTQLTQRQLKIYAAIYFVYRDFLYYLEIYVTKLPLAYFLIILFSNFKEDHEYIYLAHNLGECSRIR